MTGLSVTVEMWLCWDKCAMIINWTVYYTLCVMLHTAQTRLMWIIQHWQQVTWGGTKRTSEGVCNDDDLADDWMTSTSDCTNKNHNTITHKTTYHYIKVQFGYRRDVMVVSVTLLLQ